MKKYKIYDDPPLDELRECIKQGYCWWCKTNGWKRLAQHTAMAHNIYADDIRKMAFMIKSAPTCIKEESEILSIRRLRLLKEGKVKLPNGHLGGGKHEYSEAGLKSLRDKMLIMRASLTEDVKKRSAQKAREIFSRPHPCPVCGKIIPRAKPICCSVECRKIRQEMGLEIGRRLYTDNHKHRLRMTETLDKVREKPKPHNCSSCGKLIPKSRPRKYCSPECASNPLRLPIEEIKGMYLNGISSVKIATIYNCCDHTIRRYLRKSGISIGMVK